MPELRWTLLILGVLFIVVLAWWERRRPRQAAGDGTEQRSAGREQGAEAPPARAFREPTLTLPEIHVREPVQPHELPVIEIADGGVVDDEMASHSSSLPVLKPAYAAVHSADSGPDVLRSGAPAPDEPGKVHTPAPDTPSLGLPPAVAAELIVEWPPQELRRIVTVRLVAPQAERFAGRAVRQALAAEGFVLGKFSIFHRPDEDRRAVLSAASLSKPGTFDLDTMDSERYGGLSLFAVLPGPKPSSQAFDELLATARNLNERLQGALQDERGGPLTPMRIASMRESLSAEPAS